MKLTGKLLLIPIIALLFLGGLLYISSTNLNEVSKLFHTLTSEEVRALILSSGLQIKAERLTGIPGAAIVKVMMGEHVDSVAVLVNEGDSILASLKEEVPELFHEEDTDVIEALQKTDSLYTAIAAFCREGDSYSAAEMVPTFMQNVAVVNSSLKQVVVRTEDAVDIAGRSGIEKIEQLTSRMRIAGIIAGIVLLLVALVISHVLVGTLKKTIRFISQKLTADDFSQTLVKQGNDELGEFVGWLNTFIIHMQGILGKLKERAVNFTNSANTLNTISHTTEEALSEMSHHNRAVSETTDSLRTCMNGALDSTNELQKAVLTIVKATDDARVLSEEVVGESHKTGEMIENALEMTEDNSRAVDELQKVVDQIGNSIQAISSIADATRMLAVNASVEAARAGKAGTGFAVVAQEVHTLSEESARGVENIALAFEKVISVMKRITKDFAKATEIMGELESARKRINTYSEDQQQQIARVAEIGGSVQRIFEVVSEAIQTSDGYCQVLDTSTSEITVESERLVSVGHTLTSEAENLINLAEELTEFTSRFTV